MTSPAKPNMRSVARPCGDCPACKSPMRTTGLVSPATQGTVRRHAASGQCDSCHNGKRRGTVPSKRAGNFSSPVGRKFEWTPEELQDAVNHAMGKLYAVAS